MVGVGETMWGRAGSARSHSPGYLQTQVERDFSLEGENGDSYPWRGCFLPCYPHKRPRQQPQNPQAVGKPGITGQHFCYSCHCCCPPPQAPPFPGVPAPSVGFRANIPPRGAGKYIPLSQAPGFCPSHRVHHTPCLWRLLNPPKQGPEAAPGNTNPQHEGGRAVW